MLGYRSLFTVEGAHDQAQALAQGQLYTWLKSKGYAAEALELNQTAELAPGVTGLLLHLEDEAGETFRGRIVERSPQGAWTSELTVHRPHDERERVSVLLDVATPDSPEGTPRWTGTPRLARQLIGVLDARDGHARLRDEPTPCGPSEVDAVLAAILDPARRGALFVAGTDAAIPEGPWLAYVTRLLSHTSGLAASYFLDAGATAALAAALGPAFAVKPGTIRTFLPMVDLSDALDARRHQELSTERILRNDGSRVARLLGWKARELSLERPLPQSTLQLARKLEERADDLLLRRSASAPQAPAETQNATEDVPTAPAEVEAPVVDERPAAEALNVLRRVVGVAEPSAEAWERLEHLARLGLQAESAQGDVADRLASLRNDLDHAVDDRQLALMRLEDEQLEHASTFDALQSADARIRRLEQLLLSTQAAAQVHGEPDEVEAVPASFDELLTALSGVQEVVFTGDSSVATDLDHHDPMGLWARKTWDIVMALRDYVRSSLDGRCATDVEGYLRNTPAGCAPYSANRHAQTESDTVQQRKNLARARVLPVPTDVASEGRVAMWAHFKIAQSGRISPRLHYYDDSARTGRVYVGHIGPHLPLAD